MFAMFNSDDPCEEQEEWDSLPTAYKLHFASAFAHKAGLGPHPGEYTGPAPEIREPEGFDV